MTSASSLTSEKMKSTSRGVFEEVWNGKDYDAIKKFMLEKVQIVHDGGRETRNVEETLPSVRKYHESIPDLTITVDDQIVDLEARAVVNLLKLKGTLVNAYGEIEATGDDVWQNRVIVHWFNEDGKIYRVRSIHSVMRGPGLPGESSPQ